MEPLGGRENQLFLVSWAKRTRIPISIIYETSEPNPGCITSNIMGKGTVYYSAS